MSIAIMAHPKREGMAHQLAEQTGAEIVWDRGQGLWDTAYRAWAIYDGEYHTVLQDDAIVADHMTFETPFPVTSWYYGTLRPRPDITGPAITEAKRVGASWIRHQGPWWAVAVTIKSDLISDMLGGASRTVLKADDARLTAYFARQQILCHYSYPSLVDHRQGESIAAAGQRGVRKAYEFLSDARLFTPDGPVVTTEARRIRRKETPMRVRHRQTGRIIRHRIGLNDPPWEPLDASEKPQNAPRRPVSPSGKVDTLEVPEGTVSEVVAWIGNDPARLKAAQTAERNGKQRKGILDL